MRTKSRQLSMETLERREVFAGNVIAGLNAAGGLTLTGDNLGNGVEIHGVGNHDYVVTGTFRSGAGTTINGVSSKTFHVVNDQIIGNLNGGDDKVLMQNSTINRIELHMGLGADEVDVNNIIANSTGDGIQLDMGTGDAGKDKVFLAHDHVFGNLSANLGDGDDWISFNDVHIDNQLSVDGGAGIDTYDWTNSSYKRLTTWSSIERLANVHSA